MSAVVALGSAENPPPRVYDDVIFSSDSSRLYAVSGNSVYVIEISTGAQIARYTFGTSLGAIDLSPDGRYLAVIEEQPPGGAGTLYRLDLASGSVATISVAGATTLGDVAFLFDGNLVVSQLASGPLHVLRAQYGDSYQTMYGMPANATITVSADASYVLVQGHSIQLPLHGFDYRAGSGYLFYGRPDPYAGASAPNPDTAVGAVSPDGSLIVQGETLRVYDGTSFASFSLKTKYPYLPSPSGMTFSEDGASLYLLSADGQIIQFSTSTWEVVASYRSEIAPVDPVSNATQTFGNILTISPDGRYLAVIGNQAVDVIDLPNSTPIAGAGDDLVTGSGALYGFGGNDVLMAAVGSSRMFGGEGDDTYYVTANEHLVVEYDGQGHDLVHSTVHYQLGEHEEDLTIGGAADVDGWGNVLDNVLTGNSGANILSGYDGNDIIVGNGGNDLLDGGKGHDVLDGGAGADAMSGGTGNDTFAVDASSDGTIELADEGIDLVLASVTHTLQANVENLTLTGTGSMGGTGNTLNNVIAGNNGSNRLKGLAGNDNLIGHLGADELWGAAGADRFFFTSTDATDRIMDFERGADKIDVSGIDANTSASGVQSFSFIGAASFSQAGQLRVYQDAGQYFVAGDVNGDGIADLLINLGSVQVGSGDFIH